MSPRVLRLSLVLSVLLLVAAPSRRVEGAPLSGLRAWAGRSWRAAGKRLVKIRRAAGATLISSLIEAASTVAGKLPFAQPGRYGIKLTKDVVYRAGSKDRAHQLDVYQPKADGTPGKRPVVVYYPGGGFTSLSKNTHRTIALEFAKRGYVVVVASYRRAPKNPYPAAHADAAEVLGWLKDNADRIGADTSKLVLAGESAGANIATSLALAASYRRPEKWAQKIFDSGLRPKAVLPACGILELDNIERLTKARGVSTLVSDRITTVREAYIGKARRDVPGGTELASPLSVLEKIARSKQTPQRPLPAFFVGVGGKDPLLSDSQRLHHVAEKLGLDSKLAVYEGQGHAFQALVWKDASKRFYRDTFEFLDRALKARSN
ncbi:MAG: alpha/beta hydrolase fold domain-containing protein [Myxococcales bacterium]|nr:alpha/beta hydrolase fold domain-containing protein [Myxococcales bacterium]